MKPNPCKCGSRKAGLQDFEAYAYVRCPECGNKGNVRNKDPRQPSDYLDEAVMAWNQVNIALPTQITVSNSKFIETCHDLQKKGALIGRVEVKANNSGYVLFLNWPKTPL